MKTRIPYLSTPEQIKSECERIQATWIPSEAERRVVEKNKPVDVRAKATIEEPNE